MKIIKKFLYLLSHQERKQVYLLLVMILIMALLDMLGVASIMPFIAVLSNPELIETNIMLNKMFKISGIFGVETNQQFLFALGIFVFIFLVISLSFRALTHYAQVRYLSMREYSLGKRLVEGYLHQPYSWFLNRHSAEIGKTILSESGKIIGKGLAPLIGLITQSAVTLALITLLILVDPKLTLIVGITLGIAYGLIYKFTKSFVTRIGKESVKVNESRFAALSEAFGASKEIKLGGLEQIYIKRFSDPAKILAKDTASVSIIGQMPRFALEALTFGGMILVALYLMSQSGTFANAVPILALYAFAGYRLLPALQQIYNNIIRIRFTLPALDSVYNDLKNLQPYSSFQNQNPLPLNENITLKNVYYSYPKASRKALTNINLCIQARSTVGLVGPTGSGKTTAVDIILGLLEPQQGALEVDGKVIDKYNRKTWQRSIGYVPQQIFLSDDSVAANIAFGVDPKDVNQDAVEHASKIANLHDFVINELPSQYQTTVGENGIRLSGGQRQRIGIARAIYHKPQILILDEATSALDNLTERAVMEAVHNLRKNITIIMIAHRLSTVKNCDNILLLEKGEVKDQGKFDKLIKISDQFRATAKNL
jgi:ABC-type multidrug transport system fused ATPase/permease subunit|tara:strand:+ start:2496 stop:4289 length:1794 start_codon:yes stop_codon:yes gene_type:complete